MNIDTNWHSWDEDLLCKGLKTDKVRGLPQREVSKRLLKSGGNQIWKVNRASTSQFALQTLLDLATILLVIVSVIAAVFERSQETFAILAVVATGAAMRILAYIGAQRIFEEKARGVIPRIRVIRQGEMRIVSAEKLVEGDIVFLEAGDTVPADLRILVSNELLVFENKITENKAIVFKNSAVINEDAGSEVPIEKRDNMLYAGTTVVSGEARAVVVATSKNTLACAKFGTLVIPSGERIKLTEVLTKWSTRASLAMIITVAVITVFGFIANGISAPFDLLLTALALAVASMSEFFTILGSIVVAISVKKADSEECGRAKIKDAASVEVMNKVDAIVLESPEMIKAGDITLTSYVVGTKFINVDEPIDGFSPIPLLKYAYLTTGTLPQGNLSRGNITPERESESVGYAEIHKAYEDYFKGSYESRNIDNVIIAGHEAAGSLESGGLDTVLVCKDGNFEAIVSGSVERVIACCSNIRKNGKSVPLTREDLAIISAECERLRKRGVYTVGVARRDSPYTTMNRVSALQMCMTFEGFLSLSDRAHGDALEVIRKCREGRCSIVCFTEGSGEDKAFLTMAGILEENDRYITLEEAQSLDKITLDGGTFAVISTGVSGAAKRRREFIKKLKDGGHTVAYVSKESKDMWTMKEASVSFAVPPASVVKKTIPQSIRAASHVIITPSGSGGGVFEAFRVMEHAKSAMLNLRRSALYLVASQMARLVWVLVSVLTGLFPADPIHLLVWGLLLDFAVVMVTAYRDPPYNMVSIKEEKRSLPKSTKEFVSPCLTGLIWSVATLAYPVYLLYAKHCDPAMLSTMIAVASILALPVVGAEMMTNGSVFKRSKRRSRAIPLMFAGSALVALFFAFVKDLAVLLSLLPITFKCFFICLIPAVLLLAFFEIKKHISSKKKPKEPEKVINEAKEEDTNN